MTLDDLCVRVAEAIGLASYVNPDDENDNRPRVPTDPYALDRVRKAVNDAQSYIARKYAGKWNCLRPEWSLQLSADGTGPYNVNSDAGVYRLPRWTCGAPVGAFSASLTGSSAGFPVNVTNRARVRDLLNANPNASGRPTLAAIIPGAAPGASQDDIWCYLLHLYPKPSEDYELTADWHVTPYRMKYGTDRHVFGMQHDQTMVTVSVWIALRDDRANESDPSVLAMWKTEAEQAIAESWALDSQNQPRSLGKLIDPVNLELTRGGMVADRQRAAFYNGVLLN